jgi:hypothetical protein
MGITTPDSSFPEHGYSQPTAELSATGAGRSSVVKPATYAHEDTPGGAERQGDRKENAKYRAMVESWRKIFS